MTNTTASKDIHGNFGLDATTAGTKGRTARSTSRWAGAASALVIGMAGVALSSPAGAKPLPKPTITLNNSGSPYVSGSNYTPNGSVVLTEWAVGTKKPISTESENATSDGNMFFYLNCDGQQSVRFQAKDMTTHKKSIKTAPAVLICIN
jgi:hypothetical protein